MVRLVYSLILYLLLPLILIRTWGRGRRAPEYRRRLGERFGLGLPRLDRSIWIHAVSVGETLAARPLVDALRAEYPDRPLVVTTMTPTGSAQVQSIWGDRVHHVYAPWDLPDAVARFVRRARPDVLVVMETELWPNMLHGARAAGARVILANARLSERSARGYARFSWITRFLLRQLNEVLAQDEGTAGRFVALGMSPEAVRVTGSIKFDITVPDDIHEQARALRGSWGLSSRPVLVAASTHRGEDELVLDAFRRAREAYPEALLILVPRHPERFESVAALVARSGYALARRSLGESPIGADVFLGDTIGELLQWYALANVAFVGGSLVEVGGHNMLEPLALGVPVLCGPHVFNFQSIVDELLEEGAIKVVRDVDALAKGFVDVLGDSSMKTRLQEAGFRVLQRNRGALQQHLTVLHEVLSSSC